MDIENFYKLLVGVLNALEDENYVLIIGKDKVVNYKDINLALVTVFDSYNVVNGKKDVHFTFNLKTSQYYDFGYYKGEKFDYSTDIIDMEDIKKVLLQDLMEFPYLNVLYKIILDKYDSIKDNTYVSNGNTLYIKNGIRLIFSDEEISRIIQLLNEYKVSEKNLLQRLRKKEF